MRYAIYKIEPQLSYLITISPRSKPDLDFRERVITAIDSAMGSLEREPSQAHKVAIIPEEEISESNGNLSPHEPGIPGIPYLKEGAQYLIFALRKSSGDSAESENIRELEAYREELEAMFSLLDSVRIGLVLLQDCSVNAIETQRREAPRDTQYERALERHRRAVL